MSSDIYTYPSEKIKQLAIKNVNEDPQQINAHIESFRRWVKSMPHLKCPTDAKFLLMFLRVAKFDHAKAQKRLDNFCTIRSKDRGHPEYFEFPNINDPKFEKAVRLNFQTPVGLTKDGEIFIMGMLEKWNPKELSMKEMMKVSLMGMEINILEEECQVSGVKAFTDMHGCGKTIMESFKDTKTMKEMMRIWQDCFPIRFRGQIIYREPGWYSVVFNIFVFFMHDKFKRRMHRIKDDLQKAFENVSGLEELLPKDMKGKNEPLDKLSENYLKRLKEFYKNGSPFKDIKVDESKRPADTLKYLTQYEDYKGDINMGTEGTYVQYNAF